MEVRRLGDPRAFLELARPPLAADAAAEARHNLILGVAATAADRPELYPTFRGWVTLEEGEPLAAGSRTPPFHAILAEPRTEGALAALVDALVEDDPGTPGIVGNEPFVGRVAEGWRERTGAAATVTQRHGVCALAEVAEVPRPTGAPRVAGPQDRALLLAWLLDFADEAALGDATFLERMIHARLERGWLWLWEDAGAPVSLAGCASPTPSGIRVGPVYTPPEHRRRGYATALVAELSRWLLAEGHRACFLYADLANPTSDAIYARIGYRRVCDSAEIRFG